MASGGPQLFCFCQEEEIQRAPQAWLNMYQHGSLIGNFFVVATDVKRKQTLDIFFTFDPPSLRDSIELADVEDLEVLPQPDEMCGLGESRRFQVVTAQGQSFIFETDVAPEFTANQWFDFLHDVMMREMVATASRPSSPRAGNHATDLPHSPRSSHGAMPSSRAGHGGMATPPVATTVTTASGTRRSREISTGFKKTKVLKQGIGAKPSRGQLVHVNWTGWGRDGDLEQEFWTAEDSSFELGQSKMFKGLEEGTRTMREGEIALFVCAPEYGWGAAGHSKLGIPPYADLRYKIELTHVEERYFH